MNEQAKAMDMVARGRESLKASEALTMVLPQRNHRTNYEVLKRILTLEAKWFASSEIKVASTLVKQIAIIIADTWNYESKSCIITAEKIEALSGCGRSARIRAVKILKEQGFFGVKEGFISKKGKSVANHYYPLWDTPSRVKFGQAIDLWEGNAPVDIETLEISGESDVQF
ncbi:hypothetical protein [Glutamicibacter ardleyensis]|uniref:hypothetical protein n=1 Tax=Glutamicibacter ardleyensis TaxID=225894 RepID=UPI003FD11112